MWHTNKISNVVTALKYVLTILGQRNKVLLRRKSEFGATDGESKVLSRYTAKESTSVNTFGRDRSGSYVGFVPKAERPDASLDPLEA
jgi:hypothetical protein